MLSTTMRENGVPMWVMVSLKVEGETMMLAQMMEPKPSVGLMAWLGFLPTDRSLRATMTRTLTPLAGSRVHWASREGNSD